MRLRDLLLARSQTPLGQLMIADPESVRDTATLEELEDEDVELLTAACLAAAAAEAPEFEEDFFAFDEDDADGSDGADTHRTPHFCFQPLGRSVGVDR